MKLINNVLVLALFASLYTLNTVGSNPVNFKQKFALRTNFVLTGISLVGFTLFAFIKQPNEKVMLSLNKQLGIYSKVLSAFTLLSFRGTRVRTMLSVLAFVVLYVVYFLYVGYMETALNETTG